MTGIPTASQQAAAGLQQVGTASNQAAQQTQNTISIFNNLGTRVSSLGQQFSATTAPVQTLSTGMNQLGITSQNTFQTIQAAGGPLNNLNSQLGQTSTAMDKTTTSGNKLVEIFRGNRGLVFGASALFGTLTGIVFEFQLVSDAQNQVSESTARLNELVAQGQQGTTQFSQAQQALAKDERFLEFSTRNLALAFTNMIPDTLLIINGILSLSQKLTATKVPMQELATSTTNTGIQIRTTGLIAATSEAPLTGLGVAGRSAGIGMTEAGVGARFLGVSLRSLLISTGIGAALVVIGLALEPVIEGFIQSRQAADQAASGLGDAAGKIGGSASQVESKFNDLIDASKAAELGISSSSDDMASNFSENTKQMIDDANALALRLGKLPAEIEMAQISTQIQSKQNEKNTILEGIRQRSGGIAPGGIGDLLSGKIFQPLKTPTADEDTKLTKLTGDINTLTTRYNSLNDAIYNTHQTAATTFGNTDIETLRLTQSVIKYNAALDSVEPTLMKITSLNAKQLAGGMDPSRVQSGGERLLRDVFEKDPNPLKLKAALDAYSLGWKIFSDNQKEAAKETGGNSKAQQDLNKVLTDAQQSLSEYNGWVMKMPQALRDATGMQLQYTTTIEKDGKVYDVADVALAKHVALIGTEAAGYTNATAIKGQSLQVQEALVEVGNKVVGGVESQAAAIRASNIFWGQMNSTIAENIQVSQQQALAEIDVTQALTNQNKNQYLVNQGMIQGKLAAQDMLEQMISGEAENKQFVTSATEISKELGITLPKNVQLSREEFQKLFDSMKETGTEGQFLAQQLNDRIAPAVQVLGNALTAKNWKDFKDAFKNLEFGDTSGKLVGKFKDFDNMIRKINEDAREMNTVFSELDVMSSLGKLSPKTFTQGISAIEDQVKHIAKLQDVDLSNIINFLDEIKKTKDPAMLVKYHDVIAMIEKDAENGYTSEELRAINDAINKVDPNPLIKLEGALSGLVITTKEFKKLGPLGSIISSGTTPGQEGTAIPGSFDPNTGRFQYTPVGDQKKDGKTSTTSGSDPKAAATNQQVAANNQLDRTIKQLTIDTNLLSKSESVYASVVLNTYKDTISQIAGNNLLDRTVRQIIIDTNLWVKANNLFDSTIAQIIIDVGLWIKQNNLLDRTARQIIIDTNLWVKTNNVFDSTVAQIIIDVGLWIKTNNILDKTIAQIIIDTNLWIKGNNTLDSTIAQLITDTGLMIKANNVYAKTVVQVAKDTDDLASSTKALTSSLSKLESQARQTAKALIAEAAAAKAAAKARSSGGGSSGGGGDGQAQHGMHTTLDRDMLILAHRGEDVNIDTVGATQSNRQMRARGGGGETTINLEVTTINELDGNIIGTTVTRKTFRKLSTR